MNLDPSTVLVRTIAAWERIAGQKSKPWTDRNPNPVFMELMRQQFAAHVVEQVQEAATADLNLTSEAQFRADLLDSISRLITATYRSQ